MWSNSLKLRFENKVRKSHEDLCWNWLGWKNEKGYGRLRYKGKIYYAHRVAYSISNNKVFSPDEVVMHLCNNPMCCNPRHLKIGTILENNQQKVAENRCYVNKKPSSKPRLKADQVAHIKLRIRCGHGTISIARDFCVSTQCIRNIKNGHTWREVTIPKKESFEFDPFADE